MTSIKLHMSPDKLEGRYKTAGDPIAKSHFHALWLLSLGYEVDDVPDPVVLDAMGEGADQAL